MSVLGPIVTGTHRRYDGTWIAAVMRAPIGTESLHAGYERFGSGSTEEDAVQSAAQSWDLSEEDYRDKLNRLVIGTRKTVTASTVKFEVTAPEADEIKALSVLATVAQGKITQRVHELAKLYGIDPDKPRQGCWDYNIDTGTFTRTQPVQPEEAAPTAEPQKEPEHVDGRSSESPSAEGSDEVP